MYMYIAVGNCLFLHGTLSAIDSCYYRSWYIKYIRFLPRILGSVFGWEWSSDNFLPAVLFLVHPRAWLSADFGSLLVVHASNSWEIITKFNIHSLSLPLAVDTSLQVPVGLYTSSLVTMVEPIWNSNVSTGW